jgi:hypothetical protein
MGSTAGSMRDVVGRKGISTCIASTARCLPPLGKSASICHVEVSEGQT